MNMATTSYQKPHNEGKGDQASNFGDKAKETATGTMDKAKGMAGAAMDKARDVAGTAMDKAKDAASGLGRRAEDATHAVGQGMQSLAGTVRENLPREGVLGSAASTVAGGLEASGRYLQQEGLQGMADDVTNMIRRNPIPAILAGIGLGFLLARITSSRS